MVGNVSGATGGDPATTPLTGRYSFRTASKVGRTRGSAEGRPPSLTDHRTFTRRRAGVRSCMADDLDLSKDALRQLPATDAPLDVETVRTGWMQLWLRECDFEATSRLLTRYLAQSLSESETAWAYIHLANSLAVAEHAAEAVHVHETFERWLPGTSPRLSSTWPYYPPPD